MYIKNIAFIPARKIAKELKIKTYLKLTVNH